MYFSDIGDREIHFADDVMGELDDKYREEALLDPVDVEFVAHVGKEDDVFVCLRNCQDLQVGYSLDTEILNYLY